MLDPDTGWIVGAGEDPATGRHRPVGEFPRDAVSRHLETADLQPARPPLRVERSGPVVVLAGAAHRLLEALLE